MNVSIEAFRMEDYPKALALWQASPGVGLSDADSPDGICRYLERNPGTSFLAWVGEELVGAVLCGHDGRRGYINHLAVHPGWRRRGIARSLVRRCMAALGQAGIGKAHVFVLRDNEAGRQFWEGMKWTLRSDLHLLSRTLP
jgi:ribosomal protein S18 acetylase RimI-like enzyme